MSRSDTIELLNETDDLERQIDLLIAQTENFLEYRDGEWNPGDPLHVHPWDYPDHPYVYAGEPGNFVRPVFEVFATGRDFYRAAIRCARCEVGWKGTATRCWMCGEHETTFEDTHTTMYSMTVNDAVMNRYYNEQGKARIREDQAKVTTRLYEDFYLPGNLVKLSEDGESTWGGKNPAWVTIHDYRWNPIVQGEAQVLYGVDWSFLDDPIPAEED